ncbi:MAG: hypothetical protein ONB44_10275 [candidate division KSB1 bacterium]|nr:hypothetical protein [candidate division KSB1 bacterium]MDZ7302510.1 hypothetical protein [candidate division KSB1 bacterium]
MNNIHADKKTALIKTKTTSEAIFTRADARSLSQIDISESVFQSKHEISWTVAEHLFSKDHGC